MDRTHRILVVDDEADIRALLTYNLAKAGFETEAVGDGRAALKMVKSFQPHLVLLDIMMPKLDGWEVCKQIRAGAHPLPQIVFLTARDEEEAELKGFDMGAVEYIVKPVRPKVLVRRLRKLLSQGGVVSDGALQHGDLYINPDKHEVRLQKQTFKLRKREFELLHLLARHAGQVLDRQTLMQRLWGEEVYVSLRTIDVHIRRIRQHIPQVPIQTIPGRGYMMP